MSISIHDLCAVDGVCQRLRIDRERLKQLRNLFYKRHRGADAALMEIPEPQREAFAKAVAFHALELVGQHPSRLDGATKLVFRTPRGFLVEAVVLRIATGRTSLCVSSQVGCAANCGFCATGKMGIAQNLSAAEILDQLVQANQLLQPEGRRVRNLVFMGMGEPFHNEENLYQALDVLTSPAAFQLSGRRIVVSTVGIPAAIVRCARRFPTVHLALSLHSARQEIRRRIMPITERYSLGELRAAMFEATAVGGQRIFVEYLLLKDLTDTPADIAALSEYLRGIPVHINLIPYNPIADASELEGTDLAGRQRFAEALKSAGYSVTIRYSLGTDIAAACGQLVRGENRRIAMATR